MKSKMRMEIKEISETGTFEGILSPYGNVDGGSDVVEPGAYTKTMKDHGAKVPMLWQHKPDVPVGELTLEDRKDGLWCKGQLLMGLPEAQKAYLLIKARIVKGLSIGFETVKDSIEDGIRHLKEVRLYEGSIVTFPMNEAALITAVKRKKEEKGDFNEEFEDIQTLNGFYDMQTALSDALRSVIWSDAMREEKISAADTILQQFVDAFSAFFPRYIDALAELYGPSETWNSKRVEIKARMEKAGATFSAANKKSIQSFAEMAKSISDGLSALTAEEAGSTTSEEKAAEPAIKSEPVADHSAEENGLIEQIMATLS